MTQRPRPGHGPLACVCSARGGQVAQAEDARSELLRGFQGGLGLFPGGKNLGVIAHSNSVGGEDQKRIAKLQELWELPTRKIQQSQNVVRVRIIEVSQSESSLQ